MPTSAVRLGSCRYVLCGHRTAREADGIHLRWRGRSGRIREDVGLLLMGLIVVYCRGVCARCRDASEGACHNQHADSEVFHA